MAETEIDPRAAIDVRVDSPAREGLTGTAPANLYAPLQEREEITIPPDFRPADAQPAWRRDFPIDWPQDQYIERRDFMKFLVGGDRTVVWPAALVSTLCLLLNVGLLRYLTFLERTPRPWRTDGRQENERKGEDRIRREGRGSHASSC
jgi:hypothetical protein